MKCWPWTSDQIQKISIFVIFLFFLCFLFQSNLLFSLILCHVIFYANLLIVIRFDFSKEAKKKQEDDKNGNFLYLVRGHPWERGIVKIKKHINQKKDEAELDLSCYNHKSWYNSLFTINLSSFVFLPTLLRLIMSLTSIFTPIWWATFKRTLK
jgi:hypothetical protein